MSATPRLGLSLLVSSQASAEVPVNQNSVRLDGLTNLSVISMTTATPPGSPTDGDVYIVGASATGIWAGSDNKIAIYNGGWSIIAQQLGWMAYIQDSDFFRYWDGTAWSSPLTKF